MGTRELNGLLSVILTVFIVVIGAWVLNGLALQLYSGHVFTGHSLAVIDSVIFGTWYFVISWLLTRILKNKSRILFGIVGVLVSGILIATTDGSYSPQSPIMERALFWVEVNLCYLVAIPIFFISGWYSEYKVRKNAT